MLKMPPYNIHSTTVGHCVYCGSKTDLTKEHIIPFGLGGDQTLLDGSCGECAEKTKRFEQDCLRGWFGAFRIKAGFAGRRRKKVDRPDHIPLTTVNKLSGKIKRVWIHKNDHPTALSAPIFDFPTILDQKPPPKGYVGEVWLGMNIEHTKQHVSTAELLAQDAPLPHSFCQTIAKIAHCTAIRAGFEGTFEPLLLDLILGRSVIGTHWMGSQTVVPEPEKTLHGMTAYALKTGEIFYLVIGIRLFSVLGFPVYYAVVGTIPDTSKLPPELPLCSFHRSPDPWTKGFPAAGLPPMERKNSP